MLLLLDTQVNTNFLAGTTSSFTCNALDTSRSHRSTQKSCFSLPGTQPCSPSSLPPCFFFFCPCFSPLAHALRDAVFCFEWRHTKLFLLDIFVLLAFGTFNVLLARLSNTSTLTQLIFTAPTDSRKTISPQKASDHGPNCCCISCTRSVIRIFEEVTTSWQPHEG